LLTTGLLDKTGQEELAFALSFPPHRSQIKVSLVLITAYATLPNMISFSSKHPKQIMALPITETDFGLNHIACHDQRSPITRFFWVSTGSLTISTSVKLILVHG
jgi:hypothetical protein